MTRIGRFVEARGHDAEALYREHGLSREALEARGARVPYALVEALGLRAAEFTGSRDIGLELGLAIAEARGFDAGGLMLMASANVESGLTRAARLQTYWGDGERLTLTRRGDGCALRFEHPHGVRGARRHLDECAMAEIVTGLRVLTGLDVRPERVRFEHPRPDDTTLHERIFGAPLEFEAERTEMLLSHETLALPMRHAHVIYCEIFEREVERALASMPAAQRLSAHVRTIVRAALTAPDTVLARTAAVLRTSTRTLQRRLRAEGTSFGAIVDAVRREMAEESLRSDVPIRDITRRLGYADATTFHRAWKRWTGQSPAESRGAIR